MSQNSAHEPETLAIFGWRRHAWGYDWSLGQKKQFYWRQNGRLHKFSGEIHFVLDDRQEDSIIHHKTGSGAIDQR